MNIKKALLMGAVSLGFSGIGHAATDIYLTGSSAFADATHTAIKNVLTGCTYGWDGTGSSIAGNKVAIFHGTNNGIEYFVHTKFNGSELGIQLVSNHDGDTATFIDSSVSGNLTVAGAALGTGAVGGANDATHYKQINVVPNACNSDTPQSASRFSAGAVLTQDNNNTNPYVAIQAANGGDANGVIGIIPFKWIATGDASFNNITTRVAYDLITAGSIKLSALTGLSADTNKTVYYTGRDIDSGTRLNGLALIGMYQNTTSVKSYMPSTPIWYSTNATNASIITTNASAKIAAAFIPYSQTISTNSTNGIVTTNTVGTFPQTGGKIAFWPTTTIDHIALDKYNNGYSSGGDLSKALNAPSSYWSGITGFGGWVSFAGVNDCDAQLKASGSNLKEISFNGSALGSNGGTWAYHTASNLLYGNYTFWSYEYMYYNSADANVIAGVNKIAAQLYTTDAPVLKTEMKVSRSALQGALTY